MILVNINEDRKGETYNYKIMDNDIYPFSESESTTEIAVTVHGDGYISKSLLNEDVDKVLELLHLVFEYINEGGVESKQSLAKRNQIF